MPIYWQNDSTLGTYWVRNGGSMLCAPTSGAMILASQQYYTGATNPAISTSWTAKSFQYKTWQDQVRNMAALMTTSPTLGTIMLPWSDSTFAGKGVSGRSSDFTRGGYGSTSFWPTGIKGSDVEPNLRARRGMMLTHGHYNRNITRILGTDYHTFWRHGGHFIAVNGFTRNDSNSNNDTFQINNPWSGMREWRRIKQIQGGIFGSWHSGWMGIPYWWTDKVVTLPVIATSAGYILQTDNRFEILEGYTQLGASN
jgi:hypothetical protein